MDVTFPPFDRLDAGQRRTLLAGTEVLDLRRDKALAYQGDPAGRCFLVVEGRVKLVMYRSDESTLELGTRLPGDWIGLPELVLGGPVLADAVALEHSRLVAFGRAALTRLRGSATAGEWLVGELARQCYALHAQVELARPGDRLARWLADHAPDEGGLVPATQDELAAAVGLSRETVNRHLARWAGAGLVTIRRGGVHVRDPKALRSALISR